MPALPTLPRVPTPDFVLALRARIGHDLLWLPGVTAVVLDRTGQRVLLVRRSDNGAWAPISGITDPDEQPAQCAVREAREETGVEIAVERLVSVTTEPETLHVNGDRAQYLDITFRCRHVEGDPHVADDESTDVAWFDSLDLPPMQAAHRLRIERSLQVSAEPWFVR